MNKADGLSRHSEEVKSGMEARSFVKRQLLDLEEDDTEERENTDNMELEARDIVS